MSTNPSVAGAIETLNSCRTVLEDAGIEALYNLTITDDGPTVEIKIHERQYILAQLALPFTLGSAKVKFIKVAHTHKK